MQSSDQDKTKIELERLNALDAKIDALANDLRSSIENIERKRRKERIQRSQERRNEQIKEEKKNQQKELKKTNKNNNNDANQNEGQWKDEYYKLTTGSGTTQDEEEIDMDVSWKEVDWDVAREQAAKQLLANPTEAVEKEKREVFENDSDKFWETFYQHNANKFFKERHYLHFVFPDLLPEGDGNKFLTNKVMMEVGSGTGSTLFPLMENHPSAKYFYAFDLSASAIESIKKNSAYDEKKKCKAFVFNISANDFPQGLIEPHSVDAVTMIFVLSAVAPNKMKDVLIRLKSVLKPNGVIFFRDYGIYDLTQMRFINKKENRKLGENYYVRGDGTTTFYFEKDKTKELFESVGFRADTVWYDTRELRNRKRMVNMFRVWITAKFTLVSENNPKEEK